MTPSDARKAGSADYKAGLPRDSAPHIGHAPSMATLQAYSDGYADAWGESFAMISGASMPRHSVYLAMAMGETPQSAFAKIRASSLPIVNETES